MVIWSVRVAPVDIDNKTWRDPEETEKHVRGIRAMLDSIGLGHIEVWTRPWKPPAVVFVDDRAVHFDGDWSWALRRVEERLDG